VLAFVYVLLCENQDEKEIDRLNGLLGLGPRDGRDDEIGEHDADRAERIRSLERMLPGR
jgi:hypothetical protein